MTDLQINILIGGVFWILGVVASRFEDIIRFLKFFNRPLSYLCSKEWHTYHYTRDEEGTPFVRYERWSIEQTRTGRYRVKTADPNRPHLKYSGELLFEGHNFLLVLRQHEQDETAFVRLKKPLGGNLDRIYGLYSTIDFTHQEYCSVILMAGQAIEETIAIEKLLAHADLKNMPTALMLTKV